MRNKIKYLTVQSMKHICILMRHWFLFPKVYQISVSNNRVKLEIWTEVLDIVRDEPEMPLLISINNNKCNNGAFTPVIGGVFFFDVYLYGKKYYTGMDSLWCLSRKKWGMNLFLARDVLRLALKC